MAPEPSAPIFPRMGAYGGLKAFQHARKFAQMCRAATKRFPADEMALADQIRRAADSVALNIGEGNAKGSNREFRQSLEVAKSELDEALIGLTLADDGGIRMEPPYAAIMAQGEETARTLYGLLRSVLRRIENRDLDRRAPLRREDSSA